MAPQRTPSVSEQLRSWVAPPEAARTYSQNRTSVDRYNLEKRKQLSRSIHQKVLDLESTSSGSSDNHKSFYQYPEKVLPPTPSGTSIHSVPEKKSLRERLKPSKDVLYNAILGTSDGITVPFAVTASLAGVTDAKLVMMAGLAELIAGAISMAAGGVLGARTEVQKYGHIIEALNEQIKTDPTATTRLITETFSDYLPESQTTTLASHISAQPLPSQLDFLLRFTPAYHDADPPSTRGVWKIAIVLGLGYFSGLVPLLPYMIVNKHQVEKALYISIGLTAVALVVFGWVKVVLTMEGRSTVKECLMGALEFVAVVAASAGLSVLIIRGVGGTL